MHTKGTTVVLSDWDAVDFLGDSTVLLPPEETTAPGPGADKRTENWEVDMLDEEEELCYRCEQGLPQKEEESSGYCPVTCANCGACVACDESC